MASVNRKKYALPFPATVCASLLQYDRDLNHLIILLEHSNINATRFSNRDTVSALLTSNQADFAKTRKIDYPL